MIRMNNAAVLCGMAIAALFMCRDGFRLGFGRCLLRMLAGFIVALLPFVLYFWLTGSFSYFIQGCFTHNFLYLFDKLPSEQSLAARLLWLFPAFVLAGLVIHEWCHKHISRSMSIVILSGVLLSSLLSIGGRSYTHYYQILAPVYLMSICFTLRALSRVAHSGKSLRKTGKLAALLLTLALLVLPAARTICAASISTLLRSYAHAAGAHAANPPAMVERLDELIPEWISGKIIEFYQRALNDEKQRQASVELARKIPESERNHVLCIDIPVNFYVYADILPCFRYFSLQTNHARILPHISEELCAFLSDSPPTYLIVPSNPSHGLETILNEHYRLIASTKESDLIDACLYRLSTD